MQDQGETMRSISRFPPGARQDRRRRPDRGRCKRNRPSAKLARTSTQRPNRPTIGLQTYLRAHMHRYVQQLPVRIYTELRSSIGSLPIRALMSRGSLRQRRHRAYIRSATITGSFLDRIERMSERKRKREREREREG